MRPSASAAAWQLPARPTWRRAALRAAAVGLGLIVLTQYLAGYFFLWSVKADPRTASPFTIARYSHYYGSRPDIRARLFASSLGGAAVMLLCGLVFVLPRRRSLHGDARFATRHEIAAAGLLGEHGVILGRLGNRCLMLAGQQGVALAAPRRNITRHAVGSRSEHLKRPAIGPKPRGTRRQAD